MEIMTFRNWIWETQNTWKVKKCIHLDKTSDEFHIPWISRPKQDELIKLAWHKNTKPERLKCRCFVRIDIPVGFSFIVNWFRSSAVIDILRLSSLHELTMETYTQNTYQIAGRENQNNHHILTFRSLRQNQASISRRCHLNRTGAPDQRIGVSFGWDDARF